MRRLIVVALLALGLVAVCPTPSSAIGGDNCVQFRNASGFVGERCGERIPQSSSLHRETVCTYWDARINERVLGQYSTFVEVPGGEIPGNPNVDVSGWVQWLLRADRRFPDGFRVFDEFCDSHPVQTIAVSIFDPVMDPTDRIVQIETGLQLPDFEIVTVPDRSVWGGLVVNVHTAFGVRSDKWQPIESPSEDFLGWPLKVVAVPRVLSFQVGGRTVPCVNGFQAPDEGSVIFPPEPPGFRDQKLDPPENPLPAEPCVFTPRAPGNVNVTANVTFTIQALYGPTVINRPDFVRTYNANLPVVELKVVNTKP